MLIPALLVFSLAWGMSAASMTIASLGHSPVWLMLCGPTIVAAIPACGLLYTGSARPIHKQSQRAARFAEFVEGTVVLGISFACAGLLVVVALPLHKTIENVAGLVAVTVGFLSAAYVSWLWSVPMESTEDSELLPVAECWSPSTSSSSVRDQLGQQPRSGTYSSAPPLA